MPLSVAGLSSLFPIVLPFCVLCFSWFVRAVGCLFAQRSGDSYHSGLRCAVWGSIGIALFSTVAAVAAATHQASETSSVLARPRRVPASCFRATDSNSPSRSHSEIDAQEASRRLAMESPIPGLGSSSNNRVTVMQVNLIHLFSVNICLENSVAESVPAAPGTWILEKNSGTPLASVLSRKSAPASGPSSCFRSPPAVVM
jgi:hypothetical protein